jgi:hypothetical protein
VTPTAPPGEHTLTTGSFVIGVLEGQSQSLGKLGYPVTAGSWRSAGHGAEPTPVAQAPRVTYETRDRVRAAMRVPARCPGTMASEERSELEI